MKLFSGVLNFLSNICVLIPSAYLAFFLESTKYELPWIAIFLASLTTAFHQHTKVVFLSDEKLAELKIKTKDKEIIEKIKIIRSELKIGLKDAKKITEIL